MTEKPVPKTKRLGPSLHWDDTAIEKLAQVSASDIAAAAVIWKSNCPPSLRGLLDAKVEEYDPNN